MIQLIKRLSNSLAQKIVNSGAGRNNSTAAIAFGLELIFTYFFGTAILMIISVLCRQPLAWLVFILGFAPLRTTAGGFHAKSQLSCFAVSSGIFILSMIVSFLCAWTSTAYLLVCSVTLILVLLLSPVEAVNKKLTQEQRVKNRSRSLIISVINIVITLLFCVMNVVSALINLYFAGVAMAAASLIIAKIKKY